MTYFLLVTLLLSVTASWVKREGYDVTSQYGHYCQRGQVYVALPWDCNGFIQCTPKSDGSFFAKWMPCAWHLQYNSVKHICDYGRGSCTNMTHVAHENCEMNPDLKFADPEHCAMYYDCKQTTPIAGLEIYQNECPYPELFDEGKQNCEPPSLVDCYRRSVPTGKCDYKLGCDSTFCLNKTDGRYPVPGEEFGNEFIICTNNKISQGFCTGATQAFDPVKLECTSSYADSIGKFCKSVGGAVFEDKSKCSQFYDCRKQSHHESMNDYQSECPYPMLFDTQKKKCRPYYLVTCALRPVPVKPCDYKYGRCSGVDGCIPCDAACAPDDEGAFPHPFDDFKYLMCKDGRTTDILSCPLGKMFDAKLRQCTQGCSCSGEIRALAIMIKNVEKFLEDQYFPAVSCDKPVENILKQTQQTSRRGAKLMRCAPEFKEYPVESNSDSSSKETPNQNAGSLTCLAGRIVGTWNPSEQIKCVQTKYSDIDGLDSPMKFKDGDRVGGSLTLTFMHATESEKLVIELVKQTDVLIQFSFYTNTKPSRVEMKNIKGGVSGYETSRNIQFKRGDTFTLTLVFREDMFFILRGSIVQRNTLALYRYNIPITAVEEITWIDSVKMISVIFGY